jgi:hypothetical protein
VLYTGPMYQVLCHSFLCRINTPFSPLLRFSLYVGHHVAAPQVYNAILRQHPPDLFSKFNAGGNLYATTIHILVSAVIKIARSTKLPLGLELFRGLGGLAELPVSFFRIDANGCRGYAEWGFLSTTSNKEVAVEVLPCPCVLASG